MRGFTTHYLLSAENKPGADQCASLSTAAIDLTHPELGRVARAGRNPLQVSQPRIESSEQQVLAAGRSILTRQSEVGLARGRCGGTAPIMRGISGVNFDEAFRGLMRDTIRITSGHGGPD